jgi:hypothetical protein
MYKGKREWMTQFQKKQNLPTLFLLDLSRPLMDFDDAYSDMNLLYSVVYNSSSNFLQRHPQSHTQK